MVFIVECNFLCSFIDVKQIGVVRVLSCLILRILRGRHFAQDVYEFWVRSTMMMNLCGGKHGRSGFKRAPIILEAVA